MPLTIEQSARKKLIHAILKAVGEHDVLAETWEMYNDNLNDEPENWDTKMNNLFRYKTDSKNWETKSKIAEDVTEFVSMILTEEI